MKKLTDQEFLNFSQIALSKVCASWASHTRFRVLRLVLFLLHSALMLRALRVPPVVSRTGSLGQLEAQISTEGAESRVRATRLQLATVSFNCHPGAQLLLHPGHTPPSQGPAFTLPPQPGVGAIQCAEGQSNCLMRAFEPNYVDSFF